MSWTTIVIQSQRSPQPGFQPFYIPNTCRSPAFFSRELRPNICTEKDWKVFTMYIPPCHLSHSSPDSESNRRTGGGLTVSIRTIQEQSWQLTAHQTFPGLSVLFSNLLELKMRPFENPHSFRTDWLSAFKVWLLQMDKVFNSFIKIASSVCMDDRAQERCVCIKTDCL